MIKIIAIFIITLPLGVIACDLGLRAAVLEKSLIKRHASGVNYDGACVTWNERDEKKTVCLHGDIISLKLEKKASYNGK